MIISKFKNALCKQLSLRLRVASVVGSILVSAAAYSAPVVVMLKPGQRNFVVKLSSNRSTGYGWYLIDHGYNPMTLQPVQYEYVLPSKKMGMTGVPGVAEFTFRLSETSPMTVVPMVTTINFAYMRPWEANPSKANQQKVVVISTGD